MTTPQQLTTISSRVTECARDLEHALGVSADDPSWSTTIDILRRVAKYIGDEAVILRDLGAKK